MQWMMIRQWCKSSLGGGGVFGIRAGGWWCRRDQFKRQGAGHKVKTTLLKLSVTSKASKINVTVDQ